MYFKQINIIDSFITVLQDENCLTMLKTSSGKAVFSIPLHLVIHSKKTLYRTNLKF